MIVRPGDTYGISTDFGKPGGDFTVSILWVDRGVYAEVLKSWVEEGGEVSRDLTEAKT